MLDAQTLSRAAEIISLCKTANLKLATVESCTGGLISGALTSISGSSDVVDRGFTTYSNEAKNELVGVPMELIEAHGAVSPEVARAMAEGGLSRSNADVTVSVTGIAGPGGGTETKPVGLVHFACARIGKTTTSYHEVFEGDRNAVRESTVLQAFNLIEAATTS
ncbi:MAG: damage-inducible protein CinA [Rhodospirillaceae bacterium]|nr:damage-inducible protein CinA [Rhodospirillaceae bacterium]|tara:strand:+ start:24742 stop:25233 length:492 start_codon:yes stop_codon:yes gene_type:complete